jgi:hypothetical protein
VLAGILLVTLAVYAPTLNDWFAGDDFWFLCSSRWTSVSDYALKAFDFRQTGTLPEFGRYRPLYPVVWRLMYGVFGLNALGYHAVLVGLHLGCTALVWFIAFRLTRLAWTASLAALIFSVHPAYVDAVAWLSGGNRVFATFPYLLSLLLFMKYLDATGRTVLLYLGSLLAFVTAILLHSAALTLAAVLPAYVFLIARKPNEALSVRPWLQLAPFGIVSVALLGILVWVRTHLGVEEQFRFGWHQYSIYGRYLGVAAFPIFRLSSGLAEPLSGLLNSLEGAASLAMIFITVGLLTQRRWQLLGIFVVWWFYVSLLPDSTLLYPPQGRVLYLPGASLAILLVVALALAKATFPSSLLRLGTRMAPLLLMATLVPAVLLALHYEQSHARTAGESERFIQTLRGMYPSLSQGSALYVVGAPSSLTLFDTYLVSAVQTFYGTVSTYAVTDKQATALENFGVAPSTGGGPPLNLDEHDVVFRYREGVK